MKEKFTKVLLVIICILLVVCLFQIGNLRQEIRNKYGHISSEISNVNHQIMNISSNVSNALAEEASIIAESSYFLGEPDVENLVIDFNATVTPKEYSKSETTATLYIGDEAFEMTRENDAFTASVKLPIFIESTVSKIVFREGDTVRTEVLDWWFNAREEAIMRTYANLNASWRATNEAETEIQKLAMSGNIDIDVYNKTASNIKELDILYILDGETIKTVKADVRNKNSNDMPFIESIFIEEEFDIPYGSTLDVCTVITDDYGFKHVNVAERIHVNDKGSMHDPEEDWIWRSGEDIIYDSEGNLLWNPYEYYGHDFNFAIKL